jgi:hypothetical protein
MLPAYLNLVTKTYPGLGMTRQEGPQHQVFSHVQFAKSTLPPVRVFRCMLVQFFQPALDHGKVPSCAQTVETRRMQWKGSDLVGLKCFNFEVRFVVTCHYFLFLLLFFTGRSSLEGELR